MKPKALFEILLLARGRLVSKDALAEALWPGDLPKNVSATLETYVSVVRRVLFEDRTQARRVMVTASGAYRLDLDQITLDIDVFDSLLERAELAGHAGRRALWAEAIAMATGELLEDEPYADWIQAERDLYRGRVGRTHLLIADRAFEDGDPGLALRHGEAALALGPFCEKAFRAIMLAHHALGHPETSRQVYSRCRLVLDAELGLDPSAETDELASAVDAGTPLHEIVVRSRPPAPIVVDLRDRDRRDPAARMPFFGRSAELERLRDHVEAARRGRSRLVLIVARPGFGRTALLDRLRCSLDGAVGRAAYGPRDTYNPALPFAAALSDALRCSPGADDAERYANSPWLSGIAMRSSRCVNWHVATAPSSCCSTTSIGPIRARSRPSNGSTGTLRRCRWRLSPRRRG